jgi:hypothetical protein
MENLSLSGSGVERRRKPRIFHPFRILVRGIDSAGEAFETATVLDNMSTLGIYLKLDRSVELGMKLDMVIQLSTSMYEDVDIAKVAVEALVVRKESLSKGMWGLALIIVKRRFV